METLEAWPPEVLLLASALLGLLVGSFLNVVVYRLPIMMELAWREHLKELESSTANIPPHANSGRFDLWWPPSACTQCGTEIAAWQNIPILSFLWLRGRCANCQAPISKRYPIVEALVGITSLTVAWAFGPSWGCLAALLFSWTLIALSLIDIDHQLLPDSVTLPLMWIGISISLVGGEVAFTDLRSSVIGAVAGYLSLWSVYHLFKLATGKEGMGYGDFKLLAAIGAWLGWQALPLVVLLSAAVGSMVGVALIIVKRQSRDMPIPFGPYLAAAGWIALVWGDQMITWYLELLS